MNTTNMCHRDLTFNISGSMVCLKPMLGTLGWHELRIRGLADDTLVLRYPGKEMMSQDIEAFIRLFNRLSHLEPETWRNSKGVMSQGEIQLMRLALLIGGVSVLTCLVWIVSFII